MAKAALHTVADHRVAHGLAHDETRTWRGDALPCPVRVPVVQMDDESPASGPSSATYRGREVLAPPQPVLGGQHRFTPEPVTQADRRVRPLVRRDAMMARPARVRMRSRKPWVFARRRLFGWKVRLLTWGSSTSFGAPARVTGPGVCGVDRLSPCAHEEPRCLDEWRLHSHEGLRLTGSLPIGGRRRQPSTTRPCNGTRGPPSRSNRAVTATAPQAWHGVRLYTPCGQ